MKQNGFSLIEILLAVAIFGLVGGGFTFALIYGQQISVLTGHRQQAIFLANEGLEASYSLKKLNFSNITDGSYGLTVLGSAYAFSEEPDESGIYTRTITITSVDANIKEITSHVTWDISSFDSGEVLYTTRFTDWE